MHSFKIYFVAVMLFLGTLIQAQPTITSFTPKSAKPGDTVTLTGTNFNTIAANNIVFFGATRATVTAATATSITATVPTGATYAPITLLNTSTNLACASNANFNPIYSPAKTGITINDFSPKVDFATGIYPSSVVIGDVDGDGKADLVVANVGSNTVSVYRNTSTNGSITTASFAARVDYASDINPISIAIGDLDGDGKLDLAVVNDYNNILSIFRNTSTTGSINSGSFAARVDFSTGFGTPSSVAISDLDGDGKLDVAVANLNYNAVSVFRNTSTTGSINSGSFAARVDFSTGFGTPSSVAISDLDGDGKPDLVVANPYYQAVSVFRNTAISGSISTESFASKVDFVTGFNSVKVAIGDLDGDGKPDLVVGNQNNSHNVSLFRNASTIGSITSSSFEANVDFKTNLLPTSVAIGDINGDGKPDLVVANFNPTTVSVFRNTGISGSFNSASFAAKVDYSTPDSPRSVAIGDLDGDSKPDLVVANGGSNSVSVLRNADIVLPINLGNFSVSIKENTAATVQWSSNSEINALEYQIERSGNATEFKAIGTVTAKGLGSNYHFVDNNPIIGINYYRLKMIDKDGTYSYSELRTVNFKQETTSLSIYPNPILNGKLNIDFGEKVTSKMHYQILNSSGLQVQQGVIVNRQETIEIPSLSKGVYVLKFEKGYKTFIVN